MYARLMRELRQGGLFHLLGKLTSLVFRQRAYLLFVADCENTTVPTSPSGLEAHVINALNIDQDSNVARELIALNGENTDYLQDIAKNRIIGFVFLKDGHVVHYSFVFKVNKTAQLLGLRPSSALIGNAFTVPAWRGRGLQARSVQARARIAYDEGFLSVVAETNPENLPSQAGLQKGGMRRLGRLDIIVLFNCLAIRWRRPAGFALFDLCV